MGYINHLEGKLYNTLFKKFKEFGLLPNDLF